MSVLSPFFTVREIELPVEDKRDDILKSNLLALKNRPFVYILMTWMLNTMGFTVVTATLVYYFKYIFGDQNLVTAGSAIMLVTSMLFIPVAVKVSERIGKGKTYMLGMSIVSLACITIFAVGHLTGIEVVYGIMFFTGVGLSTHYVMPWSIVPDTIDYEYAESGVRREGVYFGLWTFIIKIGQALAGLFIGIVLDLFGYMPDVAQTETTLFGIRLLVGPLTAMFFILGNVFLWIYPIDRKMYDGIKAKIDSIENQGSPGQD